MAIPAGTLNQRVVFSRRAVAPSTTTGTGSSLRPAAWPGFTTETMLWARWKEGRPRVKPWLGGEIDLRGGTLSVRQSAAANSIGLGHRAFIRGVAFEITSVTVPQDTDGMIAFEVTQAYSAEMYDAEIEQRGENVIIRRIVPNAPHIECVVPAVVTGYSPEELAAGMNVGERRVLVRRQDLEAQGFPLPPEQQDRVIQESGSVLTVQAVDLDTHRSGSEVLAYELRAS